MVLVSSFYAFPCKNGSIAKQTIFQQNMQSDAVQYFSERTLIYRKILNGIFLPLFFRLSMASAGTLGEVPEFGHFVFFLPTVQLLYQGTKKKVSLSTSICPSLCPNCSTVVPLHICTTVQLFNNSSREQKRKSPF